MVKKSKPGFLGIFTHVIKILTAVASVFFLFRKRKKISGFFKNSNFLVAALYGILLSAIAIVFRLILALNWIIQNATK
jgi:hypothetical protein